MREYKIKKKIKNKKTNRVKVNKLFFHIFFNSFPFYIKVNNFKMFVINFNYIYLFFRIFHDKSNIKEILFLPQE